MTQNVTCKLYEGDAILCPSCEYGIIYSFRPSVFFHTYNDGTTRADITMHMKCPYCGDDVLISGYGNKAGLLKAVIQHVLKHRLVPVDRPIAAQTAQGALQEQLANIIAASIEPAFIDLYRLYLNEGSRFPAIFEAFSPQEHTHRLLVEQLERHTAFEALRVSKDEAASTMLAMA